MSSEACTRVPVHMCATFSWLRQGVPPSSGCNQELTAAARSATFSWLQPGAHGCGQECHLLLAATRSSRLRPGVPPSPGFNQEFTAATRSATFSWRSLLLTQLFPLLQPDRGLMDAGEAVPLRPGH